MKTHKKEKSLKIIFNHPGKKLVYEIYQKQDPLMAEKYVSFISKHQYAQYISWDPGQQNFVA